MGTSQHCLLKYYRNQEAEFQHQFQLAGSELGEESIHDLRVSLKKIRALFRLIEHLNSDFSQKNSFRLFRKVFKEAGLIRDIQVQIELMTDFNKSSDQQFKSYLGELEIEAKIRFRQKLALTNLEQLSSINSDVEDATARIYENELTSRIIRFIIERIESTTRHFQNGTNIDKMHRSRILLKDAYYMLQMLQECDVQPEPLVSLLKRVDQLQDTFGTWHDWEVVLHHFEDYLHYQKER